MNLHSTFITLASPKGGGGGAMAKRRQRIKTEEKETLSAKIGAEMRTCGISVRQAADTLGIEEAALRQRMSRGVMRNADIVQLANLLRIEPDTLRGWGVREPFTHWTRGRSSQRYRVPPLLLQAIAESGADVTMTDIAFLERLQRQLKRPMSPQLVKELLAHRY